jgi:hypothetical protein
MAEREPDVGLDSPAMALSRQVSTYLHGHPGMMPVVTLHQPKWGVVAGSFLELQKEGLPVAVERQWVPIFSAALAPTGEENIRPGVHRGQCCSAGRSAHCLARWPCSRGLRVSPVKCRVWHENDHRFTILGSTAFVGSSHFYCELVV